eukprot:CAMPEP_0195305900 /NCGR_PEP_ID=MMETSP0707-20130614/36928_1 /TAXON_ID=33640 /ORGANISM="Asterionellopsis glacialis, Strain CCMP134" /LENGTH=443 /DNA_ID=CAMNT_0040370109 /DNA_START=248 /DNA_END=1580 /DNA_ORIENTATION=-
MISARKNNQKLALKQQQTFCFDHYHGNEKKDIVSVVDEFLRRENKFSECFVPHSLRNGEFHLSSKFYVYPEAEDKVQLHKNISEISLKRTTFKANSAMVQGQTILNGANRALRSLRKVLPIAEEIWDFKTGNHKLGSGGNDQKAFDLLLDKCYEAGIGIKDDDDDEFIESKIAIPDVVIKKEKEDSSIDKDMDTSDKDTSDKDASDKDASDKDTSAATPPSLGTGNYDDCQIVRPTWYFFPGFMAFVLYGPIGNNIVENKVIDFFRFGKKKKEYGRRNILESQREHRAKERHNDPERGLSAKDQIQLSALDLKQQSFQQGCRESQLLTIQQLEQKTLADQIKIIERRIDQYERANKDTTALKSDIDHKMNSLRVLQETMTHVRLQTEAATLSGSKRTLETINLLGTTKDDLPNKNLQVEIHSTTVSEAGSDLTLGVASTSSSN